MVLNIPVSALSIKRFWSTQDKVMDKRRGHLELETARSSAYRAHSSVTGTTYQHLGMPFMSLFCP